MSCPCETCEGKRAELAKLKREVDECERYAGRMEAALEHIRTVCKLGTADLPVAAEVFDVISSLARVRDNRGGRLTF